MFLSPSIATPTPPNKREEEREAGKEEADAADEEEQSSPAIAREGAEHRKTGRDSREGEEEGRTHLQICPN